VWASANDVRAQAVIEEEPDDRIDVLLQPFAWMEFLRNDVRPESPVTRRVTLAGGAAPLPFLPGRSALLFSYRNDQLAGDLDGNLRGFRDTDLHAFELGLPMNLRLTEHWALNLDPRLMYNGRVNTFDDDGIDGSLRAGVAWRVHDDVVLSLTVLTRRTAPIPLPVLGVYWRPSHGRFRIDALLPRYAEMVVGLAGTLRWFGMFHFEGQRWIASDAEDNEQAIDIRRTEIRLHSGIRWNFFGPFGIEVGAHWVPWQQLRGTDRKAQTFRTLDDVGFTVNIGLANL